MARKIEIAEKAGGGFTLNPSPAKQWTPQEVAACLYSCLGIVLAMALPQMPEKKKVKLHKTMPGGPK